MQEVRDREWASGGSFMKFSQIAFLKNARDSFFSCDADLLAGDDKQIAIAEWFSYH
ncbi:MAG: hypothetical protein L0Z50_27740 [Verrucomicrobiales bacterium]|nr:hypothetical protein [Verrucomicrobiales bacterium]